MQRNHHLLSEISQRRTKIMSVDRNSICTEHNKFLWVYSSFETETCFCGTSVDLRRNVIHKLQNQTWYLIRGTRCIFVLRIPQPKLLLFHGLRFCDCNWKQSILIRVWQMQSKTRETYHNHHGEFCSTANFVLRRRFIDYFCSTEHYTLKCYCDDLRSTWEPIRHPKHLNFWFLDCEILFRGMLFVLRGSYRKKQ